MEEQFKKNKSLSNNLDLSILDNIEDQETTKLSDMDLTKMSDFIDCMTNHNKMLIQSMQNIKDWTRSWMQGGTVRRNLRKRDDFCLLINMQAHLALNPEDKSKFKKKIAYFKKAGIIN